MTSIKKTVACQHRQNENLGSLLALALLLFCWQNCAVGQHFVIDGRLVDGEYHYFDDGEPFVDVWYWVYDNNGVIKMANAYSECVLNNFGTIDTVTLDGYIGGIRGGAFLRNWGTVGMVNMNSTNRGDAVYNMGAIGTLDMSSLRGDFYNEFGGSAETVNVSGARYIANNGTIHTLNVSNNSRLLWNGQGTIDTVNIGDGGSLGNYNIIGTVNVDNGGLLENIGRANPGISLRATMDVVNLTGGVVVNTGRINEMTYIGGTYDGVADLGNVGWLRNGTIGTLTLAGDSANNTGNWGIVENLKFHSNGAGLMTVAYDADFGFTSAIQATNSVDLTYGNIRLDLTCVGTLDDFSFESFFGGADVTSVEGLYSVQALWGNDFDQSDDLYLYLRNEVLGAGVWSFSGQVSPTAERWWRVFLTGHVDSFSLSLQCTIL